MTNRRIRLHANETNLALACRTPDQQHSRHHNAQHSVLPTKRSQPGVGTNLFGLLTSANPWIRRIGTRLPTTDASGEASAKLTPRSDARIGMLQRVFSFVIRLVPESRSYDGHGLIPAYLSPSRSFPLSLAKDRTS